MTLEAKEKAEECLEVYGSKENAIWVIKREINFRQINGTMVGVRYWTEVLKEIEKL